MREVLLIEALNRLGGDAVAGSDPPTSLFGHHEEGMKILCIPPSLSARPTHDRVELKTLHIPASLPKPGTVFATRKEADRSLRVLKISASLKKPDDLKTPQARDSPHSPKLIKGSVRPLGNKEWLNLPRPTPDVHPVDPVPATKGEDSAKHCNDPNFLTMVSTCDNEKKRQMPCIKQVTVACEEKNFLRLETRQK
ncbi:hypothetical protein AMTR_s00124p00054620 [Amborella trichopoda]|uniref:Uncharacterized protein n=1 Tax=Amborella trichopoda TaxID=13333 RepID=W1NPW8_AMBTC|nr:hypothetical protein AMTR_s00124p00054620 [Amborella trichopoda]